MIILSDCFTQKVDEGCLKVANSLAKKIKAKYPDTTIVSYDRQAEFSDIHLNLNKLFLNRELIKLIRSKNEPLLYVPFASNTTASALRTCILSFFSKNKVKVLFALRHSMNALTKLLLKLSGAEIITLSKESYDYFTKEVGNSCTYLTTGVDTVKFVPVDKEMKGQLRQKYNIAEGKKVLLHVGHLKSGRNVDKLLNASDKYHIILVVSSVTEHEREAQLRKALQDRENTTIIDTYLENVEEVYQLADVYLFPVQEAENCIDVPLSVLEAASCNVPVVTTEYGELKAFIGEEGFKFIKSLSADELNSALDEMSNKHTENSLCVKKYDWGNSIERLLNI